MAMDEKEIFRSHNERSNMITKDLNKAFRWLLNLWWLFLIVDILGGLAGIWYAASKKPVYKSRLTFALDEGNGSGIGSFLNLASQFGFSVGESKDIFSGDNILEIMKSRRMLERVLLSVDTFDNRQYALIEYYFDKTEKRKSNPKLENIHFPAGQIRTGFSYKQDSVLYKTYLEFADNYIMAQRPDRKLGIYEVNVTSPDEKFTKDFTDRIVAETNSFYIEIRTKKAKETLDILEQRVASMKDNLNSSITNKASVQDVNVNPAFSAAQVPVLKQQTNIQVYSAAYGEMFKDLELARFNYLNEIPLMQIIDNTNYPMEIIKLGKLKTAILFAAFFNLLLLLILWIRKVFK